MRFTFILKVRQSYLNAGQAFSTIRKNAILGIRFLISNHMKM